MKTLLVMAGMAVALCGCTTTGEATAWGKPGVSRIEYGTDIGLCSGNAALANAGNGANTAGGVSGSNNTAGPALPDGGRHQADSSGSVPATAAATSNALPASGTYSGTVSSDYAQRAALQQRTQEMLVKRAQEERFRSCLTEKGYSEFALTPEQREHLGSLKPGSNEYHEYLFSLGTNPPAVPTKQ
jgi:hypothetical protein